MCMTLSDISSQLSALSFQLSAFSFQLSALSFQLSAVRCQHRSTHQHGSDDFDALKKVSEP
ncbi:MAG: hypothetical protein LC753_02285 [Acidobacteria bacterium]|nr:hypothetical protein [Acidobacteriota bacterium]MCA1649133.1 hypothetical protein [Acidobacteriota bacterium]